MDNGTKDVVIIQKQCRCGFKEFIDMLSQLKEQQKLDFSVESISDDLYHMAQYVSRHKVKNTFLRFPLEYDSDKTNEIKVSPVIGVDRDEYALLKVWKKSSDRSTDDHDDSLTKQSPKISNSINEYTIREISSGPSEYNPRTCRFATFNVNDRVGNASHIIDLLYALDLDVICLQECSVSLATRIKSGLGYNCVYAPADYCGNAILTRLPVLSSWTVEMSHSSEIRSAAIAILSIQLSSCDNIQDNVIA